MTAHDSKDDSLQKSKIRPSILWGLGLLAVSGSAIASIAPGGMPDIGNIIETNSNVSIPPWERPATIPASEFPRPPWEQSGDWLNGGDILGDLLGISQKEDEIFNTIHDVVLGQAAILQGKDRRTLNPYELRLPEETSSNPREDAKIRTPGVLTTSKIVRQRDFANMYDQTTARSAAAPYLGLEGEEWLDAEVQSSTEIMAKAGENVAQASTTAAGAQELTSTQDVLKQTTQVNAMIANQMAIAGEMDAESAESLLAIQRISAISAGLAANNGEALDETNRRARVERAEHLNSAANASLFLVGAELYNKRSAPSTSRTETPSRSPIAD